MRLIVGLLFLLPLVSLAGCPENELCKDDHCVCSGNDVCDHACDTGGLECHIQGSSGPVDVQCAAGEECNVECNGASSCEVECNNATECHVTCPATGCTVSECSGTSCVVSCGLGGPATRTGTTATCP